MLGYVMDLEVIVEGFIMVMLFYFDFIYYVLMLGFMDVFLGCQFVVCEWGMGIIGGIGCCDDVQWMYFVWCILVCNVGIVECVSIN